MSTPEAVTGGGGLPASACVRGRARTGELAAFERVRAAFLAARAAAGGSELRLVVGARPVRVVFAGAEIERRFAPALGHLRVARRARPALTVLVWDSASSRVALPPGPADRSATTDRFARVVQRGAGLFTFLDRTRRLAIVWCEDAAALPSNEWAAPLRVALHLAFSADGLPMVHGGAVGTAAGGVLITGRSGAGKSTAALACLRAGLAYAGDDYVLVSGGAAPQIHSLYATAKLDAPQLARFPELRDAVVNAHELPDEKAVILLPDRPGFRPARQLALRAVVVPRVTGGATELVPADPAEVLSAVAPSTIFQLPETGGHTLQSIAAVLRGVPRYTLAAGPDLARIPELIRALLDGDGR